MTISDISKQELYKFRISNEKPNATRVSQAQLNRQRVRRETEDLLEQRKLDNDFELDIEPSQ